MYIREFKKEDLNNKRYYKCNIIIGRYLIKKNIPLLSRIDNTMVFVKTKRLKDILDNMPFYLHIFRKKDDYDE